MRASGQCSRPFVWCLLSASSAISLLLLTLLFLCVRITACAHVCLAAHWPSQPPCCASPGGYPGWCDTTMQPLILATWMSSRSCVLRNRRWQGSCGRLMLCWARMHAYCCTVGLLEDWLLLLMTWQRSAATSVYCLVTPMILLNYHDAAATHLFQTDAHTKCIKLGCAPLIVRECILGCWKLTYTVPLTCCCSFPSRHFTYVIVLSEICSSAMTSVTCLLTTCTAAVGRHATTTTSSAVGAHSSLQEERAPTDEMF